MKNHYIPNCYNQKGSVNTLQLCNLKLNEVFNHKKTKKKKKI